METPRPGLRSATVVIVIGTTMLAVFGLVMLYGANSATEAASVLSRQAVALLLGLLGAGLVWMAPYDWLKRGAPLAYLVAIGLLITVLASGREINGARRWIEAGGFRFQPSDFAKLAVLLALASYCARAGTRIATFKHGILAPAALVGAVSGLVFFEPDWGTSLIITGVSAVVLLVSGVRRRHIILPALLGVVAVGVAVYLNPLRNDRLYSWLHLEQTKETVGYQAWQARIALGAGGWLGVGFDRSSQRAFVPERYTDFIFAIIGEEFGFAGSLVLMGMFAAIFRSGMVVARHAPDTFGTLLATGISVLIGGQALCNMAVVSSALPNKGLTLPFISQGGSNLMMMLICVGVLLRIARAAEERVELADEPLTLFDHLPPMPARS